MKNTLAVVQSLARQPGAKDLSVEGYRERLIGRIHALSRAHDQLLETNWKSADLATLVEATLCPYGRATQRNIVVSGPAVQLTPKLGLGLSLVLHELATNASKHGSLSVRDGHLSVNWRIENVPRGLDIHLSWRETNGPHVTKPVEAGAKGFGMELIERASVYELAGNANLQFLPEGLVVDIDFPYTPEGS